MQREPTRLCLIGWGAIATAIHRLLTERQSSARIVALAVRDRNALRTPAPTGSRIITDPAELSHGDCDLVVEVAGRDAVEPWARTALGLGLDFVMGSPSAMANPETTLQLEQAASRSVGRLILPAGSLGGIGALASAARMDLDAVTHEIVKPPLAWRGTEAESRFDLARLRDQTLLFEGTAREAAQRYPANANSVVVTSLAGLGLDRTVVRLIADAAATGNRHHLNARGAFGVWSMTLDNAPLADNPKSSAMTALNLVRVIENRTAGIVF